MYRQQFAPGCLGALAKGRDPPALVLVTPHTNGMDVHILKGEGKSSDWREAWTERLTEQKSTGRSLVEVSKELIADAPNGETSIAAFWRWRRNSVKSFDAS